MSPSSLAPIGRVVSRYRNRVVAIGLFIIGAILLAAAALMCYAILSTYFSNGRETITDPASFYQATAGVGACGIALILAGIWAGKARWVLGEEGIAHRAKGRVRTWRFDEIAATSRFYKYGTLLVGLAWCGEDGKWVSVDGNLNGFYKLHDALTAATTAARAPRLLERLQRGETLEFKEWSEGVASSFMMNFGNLMNRLAPKAKPVFRLTRDTLTVGDRALELDVVAKWDELDTRKPVMRLYRYDGAAVLTADCRRLINYPLLMALIAALVEQDQGAQAR